MKSFKVKIIGLSPYLQDRMDDQTLEVWEKKRGLIHERSNINQSDLVRAEFACHRNKDGKCFIPSEQLRNSFINAGSYVKSKVGGRSKSMKQIVAAMFMVTPEEIVIPDYDTIDKRSAVNNKVKARIIKIRPRWNNWSAEFILQIQNDSITKETVQHIIEYSGEYVGIGSFRPTNNGMFGRFLIKDFSEVM